MTTRRPGTETNEFDRPTPDPQRVEIDARFLTFEPHGNLIHNRARRCHSDATFAEDIVSDRIDLDEPNIESIFGATLKARRLA